MQRLRRMGRRGIAAGGVLGLVLVVWAAWPTRAEETVTETAQGRVAEPPVPSGRLRGPPEDVPPVADDTEPVRDLATSVTWWDGDRRMRAWVDPKLLVEFPEDAASSTVKDSGLVERVRLDAGDVRVWEMAEEKDAVAASEALAPGADAFPVLRDGPHSRAPLRALTGRIVVQLDPGWSGATVASWATSQGLEVTRHLTLAGNWYVFTVSGSGLDSLHAANRLRDETGVLSASPDWWRERTLR